MSFGVVLKKECMDNIRDKRTILSSFSLALLGPVFFVGHDGLRIGARTRGKR